MLFIFDNKKYNIKRMSSNRLHKLIYFTCKKSSNFTQFEVIRKLFALLFLIYMKSDKTDVNKYGKYMSRLNKLIDASLVHRQLEIAEFSFMLSKIQTIEIDQFFTAYLAAWCAMERLI